MKNQNGITLITLTLTIAIMIILTFTITVNIEPYINQKTKTNFETDMSRLKEEISQYYARVKDIPTINRFTNITMLEGIKNVNDDDEYYVIDIKQLEVKLNYGADYYTISKKDESEEITDLFDVYIINKQSHTIYYPKGVKYNGTVHYRLPEVYSKIEEKITAIYYIDTDNIQTQMLKKGQSALDISFTPTKEEYIFLGWREDTIADGNVLTEKVMSTEPITLYAVFEKEISLAYNANGGSSTPATKTDYIYYNNGTVSSNSISFTLANKISRSGYVHAYWNVNSAQYNPGANINLSDSATAVASWKATSVTPSATFNMGLIGSNLNYTNGDNGSATCGNVSVGWQFSNVAYYGCNVTAASTNAIDLRGYTGFTVTFSGYEIKTCYVGFGTSRGSYNVGVITSNGASVNFNQNLDLSSCYLYLYGEFSENADYKTGRGCGVTVNSITFY